MVPDTVDADSEFAFELRTCRWAEREWPPDGDSDADTTHIVARQLGTKRRRWDTIVLECDPGALAQRANFGPKRLESDHLHIVRNAPAEWTYYRDALPHPGYPWRYVREAIHEADDRGILEARKQGNRIEIRRKWPYPDWCERIVAIENKPDLDASAARALGSQLEYDVAVALADEVWVATRQTGERVEPVLLEDLPVEAGVLALDPDTLEADVLVPPQPCRRRVGDAHPRAAGRWHSREFGGAFRVRRSPTKGRQTARNRRTRLRARLALVRRHDAPRLSLFRTASRRGCTVAPSLWSHRRLPDRCAVFWLLSRLSAGTAHLADQGVATRGWSRKTTQSLARRPAQAATAED